MGEATSPREEGNNKRMNELKIGNIIIGIIGLAVLVGGFIFLLGWGIPTYNVWGREMSGRAQLSEAEWSKQVAVEEAKADLESEKLNALAEIERARGVAEANRIIGDSLAGNEAYLRYLWITKIEEGENKQVIYVPTEAGLPILEAQRLQLEAQTQAQP